MSWSEAVTSLRSVISDDTETKLSWRKPVFGDVNGENLIFKTLEYRRITDFTDTESPRGVFVDGELVSVSEDFPDVGQFKLASAPEAGSKVEATYNTKWFTDDELQSFLQNGSNWLGFTTSYGDVVPGLRPSVLQYAAGDAYSNLALRLTRTISENYKLEDMPKEAVRELISAYRQAATDAYDTALKRRDEFYTRQGQALQPLFANVIGDATDPQPKS